MRHMLSTEDLTPDGINRRRFLQLVGMGLGSGLFAGGVSELLGSGLIPNELRDAWAGTPVGPTDGILVLVGFDGGNDYLNTVVPYTNSRYYQIRPRVAIPARSVLRLKSTPGGTTDSPYGLHPRLPFLKKLYDRGQVAVVQGIGYQNPDHSHFSSMANWQAATVGNPAPTSGWVGRWLDGLGNRGLFSALTISSYLPLALVGNNARGVAVTPWGTPFGGSRDANDMRFYNSIRHLAHQSGGSQLHDALAAGLRGVIDVGQGVAPLFSRPLPSTEMMFVKKMTLAARMINANLGLRVVEASLDGFDTHSSQPGVHNDLMATFDAALEAFYTTLDDRFRSRVTIMTYSEFGRTPFDNDSDGTDHGTESSHFIIGPNVKGGLYGSPANLSALQNEWSDLPNSIDFRSMYSRMIDSWLGGGASSVIGSYPQAATLPVFKRGPGGDVATGSVPVSVLGDYVGLTPARLYNSRDMADVNGRRMRLGAGTTAEIQVLGRGGVPTSGVTAVALNVVSVNASQGTTLTVWPTGEARPNVANIRTVANRAVPNLVIVKVGQGGRVNVFNNLGTNDVIADVVGYFRSSAAEKLVSIVPIRALNTRDGTGGRRTALGPKSYYDVDVTIGGIPETAKTVVLNVTAVLPTAKGFATVYPAGVTRPTAASLNFEAGQTVPNLVLAKVGAGGKVRVYNENGNTHFVADILGYFTTAGSRHFPLPAGRIYDGLASNTPLRANSSITIPVLGRGGVPSSGVRAVVVNISALEATENTFMTCYPNGESLPRTANINPLKGVAVANSAIVKVGSSGSIRLYNKNGSVKPIVDVVGYFA
jgi:uncharacterized protein (DUF1501 family)